MKTCRHITIIVTALVVTGAFYSLSLSQGADKTLEQNKEIAELEREMAGRGTAPAEEVFKNIQIFKGFQALRVLRVMNMFTKVLGVDCAHCHVKGEWSKDDKTAKQTARAMWNMMGKVNQNVKEVVGKGTVNCYTCHRGQIKPALNPPQ